MWHLIDDILREAARFGNARPSALDASDYISESGE
jgi:hypothetical protein